MTARHVDPGASDYNVDLHLATDRMAHLQGEALIARRTSRRSVGFLAGARERVGRGLISLGSAIAPDRPFVSGPARRP